MRVLVACEFSGVVRRAFRALGHEAWSCDLLPAEDGSPHHLQADIQCVLKVLGEDLPMPDLLIAHPPCTYLCNSGVRWLAPGGRLDKARHEAMQAACDLFAALYNAPVARVAVENPVMHTFETDRKRQTALAEYYPSVSRCLYGGRLTEDDNDVANALAWFALEEVGRWLEHEREQAEG